MQASLSCNCVYNYEFGGIRFKESGWKTRKTHSVHGNPEPATAAHCAACIQTILSNNTENISGTCWLVRLLCSLVAAFPLILFPTKHRPAK